MRFLGLDGKVYNMDVSRLKNERSNCSSYHLQARKLLSELFPLYVRVEEFCLPGSGNLYLDFFIPLKSLAVEVQGSQHQERNYFFHKTNNDFFRSKNRDKNKREWCAINNINLVELLDSENIDEWRRKIKPS